MMIAYNYCREKGVKAYFTVLPQVLAGMTSEIQNRQFCVQHSSLGPAKQKC
jgi:hypothetical protein